MAEEGAGQTEAFGGAHLCGWKQGGREGESLTAGVAQGNRSQVRLEGSSAGQFGTLGGVGGPLCWAAWPAYTYKVRRRLEETRHTHMVFLLSMLP